MEELPGARLETMLMAYADRTRRGSPLSIAAAVGVHLLIGYAFITGTAMTVITGIATPLQTYNVPEQPVPPPPRIETRAIRRADAITTTRPVVTLADDRPTVTTIELPQIAKVPTPVESGPEITSVVPPSQAKGPAARGDRARWITTEDYPSAAIRAGEEGVVTVRVAIGADGRVSACEVAASSGSASLDRATCTLYARRAHFAAALDPAGRPIAATYQDRIRWQLPAN